MRLRIAIFLCIIVCLHCIVKPGLAGDVASEQYQRIEQFMRSKNYVEAKKLLRPLAENNDPYALYVLGLMAGYSNNEKQSPEEWRQQRDMLLVSARLGYLPAMAAVAFDNLNFNIDVSTRQEYYQNVLNAPPSCHFKYFYFQVGGLGVYSKYGLDAPSDVQRKTCLELAADCGFIEAVAWLYHQAKAKLLTNEGQSQDYYEVLRAEYLQDKIPHVYDIHIDKKEKERLQKTLKPEDRKEAEQRFVQWKKKISRFSFYEYYR